MQENPKDKPEGTWSEDQKDREYYYDDAHGYEEYDPECDDDDAEIARRGEAVIDGRGDAESEGRGDGRTSES